MLEPLLQTLGIPPVEQRVFISLAELGKAPASLLAKNLKLPRSTVYTHLDSLLQRGLVSIEHASGISLYLANAPDSFERMITREREISEREFQRKKQAASELIPMLTPVFKSKHYSVPKLQFFEGTANVQAMLYDHCRDWQKSIAKYDNTWWGYQDHEFVEQYREWLDFYWNSMTPDEKIFLFSNRSKTERGLKNKVARRKIQTLGPAEQFSSTIWALGDYVVTIMSRQQPHYAVQLQDAVFASNQRLIFQLLWKQSAALSGKS